MKKNVKNARELGRRAKALDIDIDEHRLSGGNDPEFQTEFWESYRTTYEGGSASDKSAMKTGALLGTVFLAGMVVNEFQLDRIVVRKATSLKKKIRGFFA